MKIVCAQLLAWLFASHERFCDLVYSFQNMIAGPPIDKQMLDQIKRLIHFTIISKRWRRCIAEPFNPILHGLLKIC